MVQISGASLVKVDRELLDEAKVAFRPRAITPDMSRDQIMMDAGAAKVLDWLDAKLKQAEHKTEVSGVARTALPNSPEAILRAAFGEKRNGTN